MTIKLQFTDLEFRMMDLLRHGKAQYGEKCEERGGPSYLKATDPDLQEMIRKNLIEFQGGWWDLTTSGRLKAIVLRDKEDAFGKKR